jgi:cytochrome P450
MNTIQQIPGATGLGAMIKTTLNFTEPNQRNALIDAYYARYGKLARATLPMGGQAVFIGEPAMIQQMLKMPAIQRGAGQSALNDKMGVVVSSDGPEYLAMRRAIGPLLDRKTIPAYVSIVTEETQAMLTRWLTDGYASSPTFDVVTEMHDLMFRIVPRTVLREQPLPEGFADTLKEYVVGMGDLELQRMIRPEWMWGTIKGNARYQAVKDRVYQTLRAFIDTLVASGDTTEGLMGVLLERYKAGAITKDAVIAELIGLFIASYETTANMTAWALIHMAQFPETYARLHEEAIRVLGTNTDVLPTHETLQSLQYAMLCVLETARMDPPTGVHTRQVVGDEGVDLGDYHLPKGTLLFGLAYKVQVDSDIWGADAAEFRPERMNTAALTEQQKEAYLPWATGVHRCAGEELSKAEAALILAMIGQAFRAVKLVQPLPDATYKLVKMAPHAPGAIQFERAL